MFRTIFYLGFLLCFDFDEPAIAQNRANVKISSTSEDSVGKLLVSELREEVNRSSLLSLVYDDGSYIHGRLVTLDPKMSGSTGNLTIYAFTITIKLQNDTFERFINQFVGTCGVDRVSSCAKSLKAEVDDVADAIRQN